MNWQVPVCIICTFFFGLAFGMMAGKLAAKTSRSLNWFLNAGGVYFAGVIAIQILTIGADWFRILLTFLLSIAITTVIYNIAGRKNDTERG